MLCLCAVQPGANRGVLQVGGQVTRAEPAFDVSHPIIHRSKHKLVRWIVHSEQE